MPAAAPAVVPVQPERLRTDSRHHRIEVQQHQVITLQPRLVADVPPGRGQPPPAREMPLAPRPPERADRDGILEPHLAALRQAGTTMAAVTGKLQLNITLSGLGGRDRSQLRQSHPSGR
jgi:hypothetical protein